MGYTSRIMSVKVGEIVFETNEAYLFRYDWNKRDGKWVKEERKVWLPKSRFALTASEPVKLEGGGYLVKIPSWLASDNFLRTEEDIAIEKSLEKYK